MTQKHVVEKKLVAAGLGSFATVRVSARAFGLDQKRSDSLSSGTPSCSGWSCFPRALGSVVAFLLVVVHRTVTPRPCTAQQEIELKVATILFRRS